MNKISLCWKVLKTDEGSLFLHLLCDDQRAMYGFTDLRLNDGAEEWPRFQPGDEVIVTIKRSKP